MTSAVITADPLLEVRGLTKSFPGVVALSEVDLRVQPGEVLALVGENGAGKSTLIKILGGVFAPDAGDIRLDQRSIRLASPSAAQQAGIGIIFQELNLVPSLSARENIFLGHEHGSSLWLSPARERREAAAVLERLGADIDPDCRCRELTIAQQQLVEIAKALVRQTRIMIMDEPSAALTPTETKRLFRIIDELKSRGIGVIYVSHRLDEVFRVADRVTVLRDGRHVATAPTAEFTRASLIEKMVGRALLTEFPRRAVTIGPPRLVVSGLTRQGAVRDVSFTIHRGEILALTGLVGAGRTETARLVFGADRADRGSIHLDGTPLRIRQPSDAIAAGICLLTEDRKSQGLHLGLTALHNFGLPNLRRFAPWGWIDGRRERDRFKQYVDQLRIRLRDPNQIVATLSGGNQQKVVLAKWLERHAEVILFDEPTRGIDVGAKHEIYLLMNQLAAQGKAILMISSELPEVLGMADRVLVMHAGRVTGEINDVTSATQEQILELAVR